MTDDTIHTNQLSLGKHACQEAMSTVQCGELQLYALLRRTT
jgi:hypothetical protein